MIAPITMLTKKNQPFIWENEQQEAFDKTKAVVPNAILCTYPGREDMPLVQIKIL
jgi:hypothetical protein